MRKSAAHLLHLALALTLCAASHSCDVHEFPVTPDTPPAPPSDPPVLVLEHDGADFGHHATVETGGDGRSRSHDGDSHDLRHIIRAYPADGSSRVPSRGVIDLYEDTRPDDGTHPDLAIPLTGLAAGEYDLMAWTEHVPAGTTADCYHDTSDFNEVRLLGAGTATYRHRANTTYREAWRGMVHITVLDDGSVLDASTHPVSRVPVDMRRPMARYHFITTDLMEFLDSETRTQTRTDPPPAGAPGVPAPPAPDISDYRVVVRYTGYMPCAYSLRTDKPVDSTTGVSYEGTLRAIDTGSAELAFDHVLVNGSATSTQVSLELYRRRDNSLLSSTGVIDVPLLRGHYTVIKGPMLTTMAGAGMGVIPDFDGEFNIEIR